MRSSGETSDRGCLKNTILSGGWKLALSLTCRKEEKREENVQDEERKNGNARLS